MKPEQLKDLIEKNPQVDADLLAEAQKEAKKFQGDKAKMVNFGLILPYASDAPSTLFDRAWNAD